MSDADFARPAAAALVKFLALCPSLACHREQAMECLWPDVGPERAAGRLHQAASYARRALGDHGAVVLHGEIVALWPTGSVRVDAVAFEADARDVLRETSGEVAVVIDSYGGVLLPHDPYIEWLFEPRDRLRLLYVELLRRASRWAEVLAVDPTDEVAHVALMREMVATGRRAAAVSQFERMESLLRSELGVGPGHEARQVLAEMSVDEAIGLIGRSVEQLELRRLLDEAGRGRGCTVLIEGEAGAGKTALCRQFARDARQSGWHLGSGAAQRGETAPFAAVLDGLSEVLSSAPMLAQRMRRDSLAELDRVRRTIAGELTDGVVGGHQRLYLAVRELAELAEAAGGLVLIFDDLHEADPDTMRLIEHLSRFVSTSRLMIVMVRRQIQPTSVAGGPWTSARHRLPIGPLPPSAALQLIESVHPGVEVPVARRIAALAGGNPFYLTELAALALAQGSLPDDLSSVVADRLDRLDHSTRNVLRAVALASSPGTTDEIVALSGSPEPDVFDALTVGLRDGFLVHDGNGYSLRHELLRAALIGQLAPHERTQVYRCAARVLSERGVQPRRVARLLIAAGDVGEAIPAALAAASSAMSVGAYQEACDLAETVLDHASGATRTLLAEIRADALAALGDQRAMGAYRAALWNSRGTNRRIMRAKLARAAMMAGDIATAAAALDGLDPIGGPSDAPVLLATGMFAYFTGDLDRASSSVGAARSRMDLGDPRLLDVLTLEGMVAHSRGEWFEHLRGELRSAGDSPELASTVFDCHL